MPKDFIQKIPLSNHRGISVYIYRLDLLQPEIQGNKYFKLKYNVALAKEKNAAILTMGGAYSNHLHATALACQQEKIPCYAFIRGQKFETLTTTLSACKNLGMQFIFVNYETYRKVRNAVSENEIEQIFNEINYDLPLPFHFVTEGGSNALGLKGAKEILAPISLQDYDLFVCPVGSGGTISGMINHLAGRKQVLGISALKDNYLNESIKQFTQNKFTNWTLNFDYHFGGFGKWNVELIKFINEFKASTQIPLCPLYSGKMMYAVIDLISKNEIAENAKVLCLHTGGLQGIKGFNARYNHLINE